MNKYLDLVATKNEPEYKKSPPLKISSVGTEIKKNSSSMPFGSAVLTNTGNSSQLKNNGITHIIHAALMPQGSDEGLFIEKAVLAMQNSIILVDRQGFDKLATCFLAGGIYCNSESTKPHLAEALVRGALSQLVKCQNLKEVIFVDFDGDYYKDALNRIERGSNSPQNSTQARVEKGDKNQNLLHKSLHGASVIVNSESAGMGWGGGISGNIQKELGTEASNVDKQRKDLMKEFNDIINGEHQGDNDNEKTSCLVQLDTADNDNSEDEGILYYIFTSGDGKYTIKIDGCHPNLNKRDRVPRKKNEDGNTLWYKLSWKKSEQDKRRFEKGDFIDIEEQKKDNGNGNDYQTPEKNDDNQNQPTKNDNDQSPNEQNEDNNKDNNEEQKPSNNNGSNDNNSNEGKDKKNPNPVIPDSVKEYFQKNKVKSVELDGENWKIIYKDKKEKKTVLVVDVPNLQDLKGYLQSQGINSISAAELNITDNNSFASKNNGTKYWPWMLGIGGILVIGVVIHAIRKKRRKNK